MHLLRDEGQYRAIVDELVEIPEGSDTRDTEAIKRISTAYLKLLYPNSISGLFDVNDFYKYCLRPAKKMRQIIKHQLGILDAEFKGKDIPNLSIKEPLSNEEISY